MNTTKLKQDAKKIANIITKTNTYYQGNLLAEISIILNKRDQSFISELFKKMADDYGVSKNA